MICQTHKKGEIGLTYHKAEKTIEVKGTHNKFGGSETKYIVDVVGDLPVILLEINARTDDVNKTYIYANSQIIAQHDGDYSDARYFYLHDRLGSVRQIIDSDADVVNYYTYKPFGETYLEEYYQGIANPFRFTGQYYDGTICEYDLRNRWYDPVTFRFTAHDPITGKPGEPLSLHKYLYCGNDPINKIDPWGLWTIHLTQTGMLSGAGSVMAQMGLVIDDKGNIGFITIVGGGGGTPAASLGGSLGWTNADDIFKLRGWGVSVGGSLVSPPVGMDLLMGVDTEYIGLEGTVGWTWAPIIEAHAHLTYTTITPLSTNYKGALDVMQDRLEDMLFGVSTAGEGYRYFMMRDIIEDAIKDGSSNLAERLLQKY